MMMKMISSDFDNKIEDEKLYLNARTDAISYIGIGVKPSLKVSGWLSRKGYPDFIIDKLIIELQTEGYIDDIKIAQRIIRTRTGKKNESKRAMIMRLNNSGIPLSIAEKCLDEHFSDPDKTRSDINELLDLKFGLKMVTIHEWNQEEKLKFRQKCFRFLTSRGYDVQDAIDAINLLMKDDNC